MGFESSCNRSFSFASAPISAFRSNFSSLLIHFRDLTTRTFNSNSNSNSKNEPSFPATTTKRNDWLLLTAKVKDRASLDKFLKERCKSSGDGDINVITPNEAFCIFDYMNPLYDRQ
ncbi:hypothetical protein AB3S75_043142 [Citrus x aurantiifolia]